MAVSHRGILLTFLAVVSTLPAYPYRREYRVTWGGERKPGSEVCFYRGDAASDPFRLFFSHTNVTCLPADQVLDFPPGLFHAFARHSDGFVSSYRDYFIYRGAPAPEAGYEILDTPLEKAGIADLTKVLKSLRPGQSVGVWVAPTSTTSGTYLPLVPGETSIMVPAQTRVLPLLIEGGKPKAIGNALYLAAGERATVPSFGPVIHADLVAWIRVDSASLRDAPSQLTPPTIELVSADANVKPLFPLYDSYGATNTLIFFKDVSPGRYSLAAHGKVWIRTTREIALAASTLRIETEPIVAMPGAALSVSWNVGPSPPECPPTDVSRPRIAATLLRCAKNTMSQRDDCTSVASASRIFEEAGTISLEGIPAGDYTVTVELPFRQAYSTPATLRLGRETAMNLPIEVFSFFGSVKLNDVPLKARLIFESGETQSDEAGAYKAALSADPLNNLIRLVACENGRVFTVIPEQPIERNAAYDIDVGVTTLAVTVVDNRNAPVADVSVWFAPLKRVDPDGTAVFYSSPPQMSDFRGRVSIADVPLNRPLLVCTKHEQYLRKCANPLTLRVGGDNTLTLRVERAVLRGRVVGHEGFGIIAWVDNSGRLTEQTTVDASGTFSYKGAHDRSEHIVYTSGRRALTVIPAVAPSPTSSELVVTLPSVTWRSFRVTVPSMETGSGFVGIWVGEWYVPLQILAAHQEMKGLDARVYPGRPLLIKDIAETGPIAIAVGRERPGDFVDLFVLPEYAGVTRHRVTSTEMVIPP